MKNQFIPFELAVKLKQLGFDEECFSMYMRDVFMSKSYGSIHDYENKELFTPAPLWQQAFDWFREKHNLHAILHKSFDGYFIDIIRVTDFASELYEDQLPYEEARFACLEKLIEIVSLKSEK